MANTAGVTEGQGADTELFDDLENIPGDVGDTRMQQWARSDRATLIRFLTAVFLTIASGSAAAQEESWKTAESACLGNIVQITNPEQGLVKAGEAYFSPDGASIIFQAVPEGKEHYQIYLMSLADRKPKLVSTGRGECSGGRNRSETWPRT